MQIGQGESLVQFFVSGFGNSPKSGRSSGEERNYDENPEKLPLRWFSSCTGLRI